MLRSSKYITDSIFELTKSTLGNYYEAQVSTTGSAQNLFDFFCLVDPANTVLGEFDYVDELNGQFYSLGSECPVPTTAFSFAQNTCQKCAPANCINCDPSLRTQCTLCDTGYGISSTGSCDTCTLLFSNCVMCSSDINTGCT